MHSLQEDLDETTEAGPLVEVEPPESIENYDDVSDVGSEEERKRAALKRF